MTEHSIVTCLDIIANSKQNVKTFIFWQFEIVFVFFFVATNPNQSMLKSEISLLFSTNDDINVLQPQRLIAKYSLCVIHWLFYFRTLILIDVHFNFKSSSKIANTGKLLEICSELRLRLCLANMWQKTSNFQLTMWTNEIKMSISMWVNRILQDVCGGQT